MRIALIAPLFESVPPKLYGGTERVVHYLAGALADLGHDVALFASGDSRPGAGADSGRDAAQRADVLRLGGCTASTAAARYNPISYHNGSVWPHDNAIIALGLARLGAHQAVERIFTGMFYAGTAMEFCRMPEVFCGLPRQDARPPTLYPLACASARARRDGAAHGRRRRLQHREA